MIGPIVNAYYLGPVRVAETSDGWQLFYNAMAGPHRGRYIHGCRGDDPDDMQYIGDDDCPDLTPEQAQAMLADYDGRAVLVPVRLFREVER